MIRKLRITLLSVAILLVVASGSAVALDDPVTVSGDITFTEDFNRDSPLFVTVNAGSSSQMEFVPDEPDPQAINITHEDGAATFDGSDGVFIEDITPSNLNGERTTLTPTINLNLGDEVSVNPSDKGPIAVSSPDEAVDINELDWKQGTVGNDFDGSDFAVDIEALTVGGGDGYGFDRDVLVTVPTDSPETPVRASDRDDKSTISFNGTASNGRATFNLGETGVYSVDLKTYEPPSVSNPQPPDGGEINETSTPVSVDVDSPYFDRSDYNNATVTFYKSTDGNTEVGSDSVTNASTASSEISETQTEENTWYVVVEDEYGGTRTSTNFSFFTPSQLFIYNESQPNELYDDGTRFDVRFIQSGEQQVVERSTTTGKVSLAGLPSDTEFIVTVRPEENSELSYRRIIVDRLAEEQEVFILPNSQANSEVKFDLDDPTGQFAATETKLLVEKPITKDFNDDGSNTTQYRVVAGDYFGSSGQFPMIVQNGERYRLRVESDDVGGSRILGAYSTNSPEIVPIQIEEIAPSGSVDGGRVVYGGVEGEQVAVRYLDPTQSTQAVEYRVVDDSGSEIVPNTTRNSQEFADFYDLPAGDNASYTVDYTITREDGTKSSGSFDAGRVVGDVTERLDTNPDILELVSYVLIIASMGLVVLVNAQLAPLTGTGVATLLTVFGTVAIPAPILGIAGAISVLLPIGRR